MSERADHSGIVHRDDCDARSARSKSRSVALFCDAPAQARRLSKIGFADGQPKDTQVPAAPRRDQGLRGGMCPLFSHTELVVKLDRLYLTCAPASRSLAGQST